MLVFRSQRLGARPGPATAVAVQPRPLWLVSGGLASGRPALHTHMLHTLDHDLVPLTLLFNNEPLVLATALKHDTHLPVAAGSQT